MQTKQSRLTAFLLAATLAFAPALLPARADEDAASRASAALTDLLFDYDGSNEFTTYVIRDDGFVEITFARNTPDPLYSEMLDKLRAHPDIKGVLPGKGGPVCSKF